MSTKTEAQYRWAEFVFSVAGAIGPVAPLESFTALGLTLEGDPRIIKATMTPSSRTLNVTMRVPVAEHVTHINEVPVTGLMRQLADLCVVRTTAISYTDAKLVADDA